MARRSYTKKQNKSDIIEEVEQVKPLTVSVKSESRVNLRLKYPVRYVHNSTITGERYCWDRINDVMSVHPDDAPVLLAKFKQNGCCGASPQRNYIFEEA